MMMDIVVGITLILLDTIRYHLNYDNFLHYQKWSSIWLNITLYMLKHNSDLVDFAIPLLIPFIEELFNLAEYCTTIKH